MNVIHTVLSQLHWRSCIDILLVSILFYQVLSLLKGTRAVQVLLGLLLLFTSYLIANYFQLEILSWIISKFYSSIIVVIIVLFQDDLRRLLTQLGKNPFDFYGEKTIELEIIKETIDAVSNLKKQHLGALIVFERGVSLEKLYDHGTRLDALVSEPLLISIFHPLSPLHDGAVIIKKNRLNCASAQLPLSVNQDINKKVGTRHRAALGISEQTDAVVIIVSEENGSISMAWGGHLERQLSPESAKKLLISLMLPKAKD